MENVIEPASSGRARCRGCGRNINKGTLRFGERLPNPFSEGKEMTHWFHLRCAALKRPEAIAPLISASATAQVPVDDLPPAEVNLLKRWAGAGIEHRRVPRIDGASRSPTGRARCRHCRAAIEKDTWRIQLVFYEEGQFNPSGYIHARCAGEYFETRDIIDRIRHFSPELSEADFESLAADVGTPA